MNIKPVVSNVIEIEHNGIKLKIYGSDKYILIESESKIEHPFKPLPDDTLVNNKAVKFTKLERSE